MENPNETSHIKFYPLRSEDGTSEFEQFVVSLPSKDRTKHVATINNIKAMGLSVAFKQEWVKKIEDDLYEIRSKQGSDIQRSFYFKGQDDTYIITHGFTKKTKKTPKREIEKAKRLRQAYKDGEYYI